MSGLLSQELYPNSSWGTREDGNPKGTGWLGGVRMPIEYGQSQPSFMTELSASDDRFSYPLLNPMLTAMEVYHLRMGNDPTGNIFDKARKFGLLMEEQGYSPFKD